jgi:E3 ubiquitin-protein ligase BRE1
LRIALEKQVSDLEKANTLLATENKRLGMSSADAISKMDALRTQISELTNIVKTKDAGNSVAKQHSHAVEVELEKLKVRYEQIQKEKDTWKAKSLKNTTAEEDDLRVSNVIPVRIY